MELPSSMGPGKPAAEEWSVESGNSSPKSCGHSQQALSRDRDSTQLDLWFAFVFVLAWPEKVDVPRGQRGLWASPPLVGMLGDPDLGSEGFWTLVFM